MPDSPSTKHSQDVAPDRTTYGFNWGAADPQNISESLACSPPEKKETGQLARNFGVVPFDVFPVTTTTWAARKYKWIKYLKLQGELGRDSDVAAVTGNDVQIKSYPGQERLQAMMKEKDIVPGGGGPNSVRRRAAGNVSNIYGPAAATNGVLPEDQQRALGAYSAPNGSVVARGEGTSSLAGTSIFDPVLCELSYRWYCPIGGSILDPFAGGATRGIVAAYFGYKYTGVEIREGQVIANHAQVTDELREKYRRDNAPLIASGRLPAEMPEPEWVCGNSTDIDEVLPIGEEYDMCFSCPPYYNLEQYSTRDGDGSKTQTYPEFMEWYEGVYRQCVSRVKDSRFVVITVGDVRDKDGIGAYYDFSEDTVKMFRRLGLYSYCKGILYTALGSLPIRTAAAFPSGRKLGHAYQQVYVFWKGPNKAGAIKEAFGELATIDWSATTGEAIDPNAKTVEE
jgi:hypothetical protein